MFCVEIPSISEDWEIIPTLTNTISDNFIYIPTTHQWLHRSTTELLIIVVCRTNNYKHGIRLEIWMLCTAFLEQTNNSGFIPPGASGKLHHPITLTLTLILLTLLILILIVLLQELCVTCVLDVGADQSPRVNPYAIRTPLVGGSCPRPKTSRSVLHHE